MRSLNKVFLLGNVGQTPELLTTKTGQPYTRLSIATHRRWKDTEEKWQEQTDWHNVMVWGSQAKTCSQGITKGALVFIEGQLSPYSHTKEDGATETRQSIHAQRVSFFNSPSLSQNQIAG